MWVYCFLGINQGHWYLAEPSCCTFRYELSSDGAWGLGGTAYLGCVVKASPDGSQVQVPQLLWLSTLTNWFSNCLLTEQFIIFFILVAYVMGWGFEYVCVFKVKLCFHVVQAKSDLKS